MSVPTASHFWHTKCMRRNRTLRLQELCQLTLAWRLHYARSVPGFPLQEPGQNRRGPRALPKNPKFSGYCLRGARDEAQGALSDFPVPRIFRCGKMAFPGNSLILVGPLTGSIEPQLANLGATYTLRGINYLRHFDNYRTIPNSRASTRTYKIVLDSNQTG